MSGAFLDTNIIVRHLTGDPPEMAAHAGAFLSTAPELLLADLIVAETVYVLQSFYNYPRSQIRQAIQSLLALPAVVCVDLAVLLRALEHYEVARLDFAEAYLAACAERTGIGVVASFDRTLDRLDTIQRLEPGPQ